VIAALRRKPVRVQRTRLDAATAAGALHDLLRTPTGAAQLPWVAHRARLGDWLPLLLTLDRNGAGDEPARQVMYWSIVCNEPWARWSPERGAAASRGTYLAEHAATGARLVAAVCSVMPKAAQPDWSRARVRSDKPVLFVVGAADPQDPLSNVADAARELTASRTVVVPAGGHGSIQLGCMPRIAQAFVELGSAVELDTSCVIGYSPPPFVVR
jgi:pimeloyl-ACP methyl ester carboxylesterase